MKIIIGLILILFLAGCKKDSEVIIPTEKEIMLQYELTSGWSSILSSIYVFNDKSAFKHTTNSDSAVEFTKEEKDQLDLSLSEFANYKRQYPTENGVWFGDIDTHEIIYYKSSERDTVSIYEPLDSEDIPEVLVNLVKLLREKF